MTDTSESKQEEIIGKITHGPVVFAVGKVYQIVYHTNVKGIAWVVVEGKEYYDECGAIIKSESIHHNVSIPTDVLDKAGEYTICFAPVGERKPYFPEKGDVISACFKFYPIDTTDGLQLYCIADSHSNLENCCRTAQYYGDKLDLLVLCGDINSESVSIDKLYDISVVAFELTKGSKPVVYARGNHELRGQAAENIGEFVGNDKGNMYYTFRIGKLWGVVLDCGEDKKDDHPEYGGLVNFEGYRQAQTSFLKRIISDSDCEYNAPGVEYRIGVCHIPFPTEKYPPSPEVYNDWTELCSQMNLDVMISGHLHRAFIQRAGEFRDNQLFNIVVCASPNKIIDDIFDFVGSAVEIDDKEVTVKFTNILHNVKSVEKWSRKRQTT